MFGNTRDTIERDIMSFNMSKKILVVDDEKSIVKILKGYLENAGFEVLSAYDGDSALHFIRREKPDLILLDVMMPERDGFDVVRVIRGDPGLRALPVIMITAKVEDLDKILGLELGADDYITKPFNGREVISRVNALLRRDKLVRQTAPQILRVSGLELDIRSREVAMDGRMIDLTPTEFNLLRAMMEIPGSTLTRDELVERGMGYNFEGMGRTLDTHIRNLRNKIEKNPKEPAYIKTVYSVGYRLVEPHE
jgi:two-component system alkaline phosphatase synthesis response regulator PhoP